MSGNTANKKLEIKLHNINYIKQSLQYSFSFNFNKIIIYAHVTYLFAYMWQLDDLIPI